LEFQRFTERQARLSDQDDAPVLPLCQKHIPWHRALFTQTHKKLQYRTLPIPPSDKHLPVLSLESPLLRTKTKRAEHNNKRNLQINLRISSHHLISLVVLATTMPSSSPPSHHPKLPSASATAGATTRTASTGSTTVPRALTSGAAIAARTMPSSSPPSHHPKLPSASATAGAPTRTASTGSTTVPQALTSGAAIAQYDMPLMDEPSSREVLPQEPRRPKRSRPFHASSRHYLSLDGYLSLPPRKSELHTFPIAAAIIHKVEQELQDDDASSMESD